MTALLFCFSQDIDNGTDQRRYTGGSAHKVDMTSLDTDSRQIDNWLILSSNREIRI